MDIGRQNKLILMFATAKNPLLARHLTGVELSPTKFAKLMDVAPNTLANWKKNHKIDPAVADKIFSNAIKLIGARVLDQSEKADSIDRINKYRLAFHNEDTKIYPAAAILKMSIDQCQNLIDEAINDRLPLFTEIYYDPARIQDAAEVADRDFRQIRGLYHAFLRRGDIVLKCLMRVRYVLKIREGITIRCKLNCPMIAFDESAEIPYWEYDGYVTLRENNMYWTFCQRLGGKSDFLYFITNQGLAFENSLTMCGTYLTSGQDFSRSTVTGDVLLRRILNNASDPIQSVIDMEAAMHNDAAIINDEKECERWSDLLKRYRETLR